MNDNARVEKILQTAAAIMALPSTLIAIIVFLASGEILAMVFGPAYTSGWNVLIVLVAGHTINVAVGSPGVLMAMSGHQTAAMLIGICAGVIA